MLPPGAGVLHARSDYRSSTINIDDDGGGASQLGFTSFDTAATQDDAVAAATRQCPDLITASVRLMDGCGIKAVKIVCANKSIPTVYIASNPEEAEEAALGNIVIAKPVARDELQQAVQRVTQRIDDRSWQAA